MNHNPAWMRRPQPFRDWFRLMYDPNRNVLRWLGAELPLRRVFNGEPLGMWAQVLDAYWPELLQSAKQ